MSSTTNSPLPIRLAQTIGITTTSFLTGTTLSFSILVVPRLLESPTPLLLKQFAAAFDFGKKGTPPLAVLAATAYLYLAYLARQGTTSLSFASDLVARGLGPDSVKYYAAAAVLSLSIIPYTLVVMQPVNKKLLSKAEETAALGATETVVEVGLAKEETAHGLLDRWASLNLGRVGLLAGAALVGAWTALQ